MRLFIIYWHYCQFKCQCADSTNFYRKRLFTVPCGVTSISVQVWGGGGGGAGDGTNNTTAGAGGGGGGYSTGVIAVVPGNVIAYTVGAGGAERLRGQRPAIRHGAGRRDPPAADRVAR